MARTCTWDGGAGDALASSNANWDTDTKPVAGDSIVFPTTTKACTWDLNLSLVTFTVNSGYVQTITQSSGANLTFSGAFAVNGACTINLSATATLSCAGFSMSTGTLNCAGGSFTSTTFALTNAAIFTGSSSAISTTAVTYANTSAITATSGTWTLAGSWTRSNTATFTHNSGTINITAAATITDTGATFNKFTINTTAANVTIAASTTCPLGTAPSVSLTTGTLTVTGTMTYTDALSVTGSLTTSSGSTVTGSGTPSLTINQSLTLNSTSTWTSVNVLCNGSTQTTYTDTGAKNSGVWTVTKASNGLTVAAGTVCNLGTAPTTTTVNTITVTGTIQWAGLWTLNGSLTTTSTGVLTGTSTPTISMTLSPNIDPATTITNAIGTITFTGSGGTTLTDTGDKLSGTTYVINKSAAALTVAANTIMRLGASPSVTIGATVTVTGTLVWSGTMTLSSASNITATGTMTGTSTPLIIATDSATLNFTSVTFTNPISVTFNQTTAGAAVFTGAGKTYTTFTRTGSGSGTLTVSGSNTFTTFQDNAAGAAHTLRFTAGTTQIAHFVLGGSASNLLTIDSSSAGSAATLDETGTEAINVPYVSVKDSTVDVSPEWYASEVSTLVSGTTNWHLGSPAGSAGFSTIIMRRRRR